MGKIMIIGAGIMQKPIIDKAKYLGHYVITIDKDINAPGNVNAHLPLEIDTNDFDSILKAAIEHSIDGILTSSDFPVRVVAKVCKALKLKGPTIKASIICTDKFLIREHLFHNNFNTPSYKIINSNLDENIDLLYPLVIKPVDSSGSRGVKRIDSINDLLTSINESKTFSRSSTVILEEFISGNEYSIEALTQNGISHIIAITEKTVIGHGGLSFVEDRHIIPAQLNERDSTLIKETVIRLIESLEIGDSATHTELKLTKNGIFIIEIGARLGGDYITSDLVPLATGIDMLENVINIALDIPINITKTSNNYSGIQFINSENYHSIKKYIESNLDKIESFHIEPFTQKELKSSFDRLGFFIAKGKTNDKLLNILNCKKNDTVY